MATELHSSSASVGVKIEIANLNFSFESQDSSESREIYKDFNLVIEPGSIVAVSGSSGTGKSTIFNLLTKLIETKTPCIKVDGKPIESLTFKDIQQTVSYVTQDSYLLRGTLMENLKYGNQGFDCSEPRLIECLKLANAFDFVTAKGGLQAEVFERGVNFSGGEKQRLVIARALVKHPRLLLLDESTSGIDSESEKLIIENFGKIRKEMTTILITHKIEPFQKIITHHIKLK